MADRNIITPEKEQCILHNYSSKVDKNEKLIELQSYASWETLLKAAIVRNYEPLLSVSTKLGDNEFPHIFYHRKCRSIFTMKKALDQLKRKASDVVEKEGECSSFKRPRRSETPPGLLLEELCIFCEKTKRIKGTLSREKLVKATQLRVDDTLRKCATDRKDAKIIALTCRDLVAAEAHYHRSCYRNYTRSNAKNEEFDTSEENHDLYGDVEHDSYEELLRYIKTSVIPNKQIVPLSSLTYKLQSIMKLKGVEEVKDSTKKNIKRKIMKYLGNSISVYQDNKGKLLVVPSTATVENVVRENQSLKEELELWKNKSNLDSLIDLASNHLRNKIKNDAKETPWPCHPTDVDPQLYEVPDYLQRFFMGLLTGNATTEKPSQRVERLTQSFSQDLVYAVTCGQQKPPKHILLTYTVKTLTGNVELIHSLNRLGHGISYSQLEENDTALCMEKLSSGWTGQSVIPSIIQPNVFTNLAWDNIDRLEETLTGKGTSHRVNGIAVQANTFGPHPPRAPLTNVKKTKQRSITTTEEEIPIYIAGEREGPKLSSTKLDLDALEALYKEEERKSQGKNLMWIIARYNKENINKQMVPSWTGFNIVTRNAKVVSQDNIGYLPTINAPATELATVSEILKRSEDIRKTLNLSSVVVVMDQALYAKASEIAWKHNDTYGHIILRLGAFHTICNFMSILGKRFQDGGLRDICIESGILGEGSVNGVTEGKMYNRAVRIHKYVYEALMRIAWENFMIWIDDEARESVNFLTNEAKKVRGDLGECYIEDILKTSEYETVLSLWNKFLDHLRHDNGDLSAFWMTYIDMVEGILLNLLRASREGNWILHLCAIRSMIPWCFAYDKVNYARYMPVYYEQMSRLEKDHPEVYESFMKGQFAVQMSENNTFGRIPVDQAIEETINKDTQTSGGTARFSLKPGAVKRYYITAEYRSSFLHLMRKFIDSGGSRALHPDLHKTRMTHDEQAVSSVVDVIKGWIDPFAEENDLAIISTGKLATAVVQRDLMNALKVGEKKYETFKKERLESIPPAKKFHDRMTQSKLNTFSSMCMTKKVKCKDKTIILKADRALFGKIIITSQARNLTMKEVLSHSLGPLPWALATPEGLPRKTNKATLGNYLQKDVPTAESIPQNSATIIDGMHLVQRLKGNQKTFGEIAEDLFSMILKEGAGSQRIDVVFDQYHDLSIKNIERQMRGSTSGIKATYITEKQIIRQWKKFLGQTCNKASLISFLVREWKTTKYRERLGSKMMFLTCDDKCYKVTGESTLEISELKSTHEEADGRLLLHADHAAKEGYQAVLICSVDTDVFILAIAFQKHIKVPLFQKCGSKNRTNLLDIEKIVTHVGQNVCDALVGLHSFTGCDTVSTFAGRGKIMALKKMIGEGVHSTFSQLGSEWNLSATLMSHLERFTCNLYSKKMSTSNINELRYHLFCAKKGEIESHRLPPCLDCLKKHSERANYQAAIWRRSLLQDPGTPTPVGRGWKLTEVDGKEQVVIDWMDGLPAPQSVLDILSCTCSKSCKLPKCICLVNGMKCTDMCSLTLCSNQAVTESRECSPPLSDEEDICEY